MFLNVKLKNFPSERCTKFQPCGEYNRGYEVTKSCRLLHPNCSRWSQLPISLTLLKIPLRSIFNNVREYAWAGRWYTNYCKKIHGTSYNNAYAANPPKSFLRFAPKGLRIFAHVMTKFHSTTAP